MDDVGYFEMVGRLREVWPELLSGDLHFIEMGIRQAEGRKTMREKLEAWSKDQGIVFQRMGEEFPFTD